MQFSFQSLKNMNSDTKAMLFHYRYEVFIKHLGWVMELSETDMLNQWEKDEFDLEDTVYVCAHSNDQSLSGCARLLPTTSSYLLESVFPELLNGSPAPQSPDIWELSRFTTVELTTPGNGGAPQFSSESSIALMKEVFSVARSHGAKHLVTVSPIGVERLLRKEGFESRRLGPPANINGYWLVACWIDL
jgi:N-acyl-L-homoserine lactone synthetase